MSVAGKVAAAASATAGVAAAGIAGALWAVTQPILRSGPCPQAPQSSSQRLRADVEALALTYQPRDIDHPDGLERAAGFIAQELRRAGGRVRDQAYETRGAVYRNVIARFGPEEGERVVVGAHYDTAGPFPGADDNASGVAGLLELARTLGRSPPDGPVELVAFTLEEPPSFPSRSMGSAVHAASLAESGVRVRLMISLEMIGFFSDEPNSQSFPNASFGLAYPSTGNFIIVVGRMDQLRLVRNVKRAMRGAGTIPVESVNAPTFIPGIDFSDHRNYWKHGFPAAMVTDTAFYRNPNYHSEDDLPDTLDYDRMAGVVDAVACAVRTFAQEAIQVRSEPAAVAR